MTRAVAARLLGISENAPEEAVRAAFRAKIQTAHPDKGGDGAAARELVLARKILLAAPEPPPPPQPREFVIELTWPEILLGSLVCVDGAWGVLEAGSFGQVFVAGRRCRVAAVADHHVVEGLDVVASYYATNGPASVQVLDRRFLLPGLPGELRLRGHGIKRGVVRGDYVIRFRP